MLVEAQLAAGAQHAVQLRQRGRLVGHRAEHQARDRDVDRLVLRRKAIGGGVHDGHGDVCRSGGLDRLAAQIGLRLDGDDLADVRRVQAEVRARAGAELQHPAAQPAQQLARCLRTWAGSLRVMTAQIRAKSG